MWDCMGWRFVFVVFVLSFFVVLLLTKYLVLYIKMFMA